jgi:hypothetical protein
MSAPPPTIFIRPKPLASSILYTVNPNYATTSSYTLSVTGNNASNYSFATSEGWYKYTVSSLTFGDIYSATAFQTDSNGLSSDSVPYRTVQTGNLPSTVYNLAGAVNGTQLTLSWQPPAEDGGATINWYVIRDLLQFNKFNTSGYVYSFDTTLTTGSNIFSVQAVNDPGYSGMSYFSTVVTTPVVFTWNLFKYDELASNAVQSAVTVIDWDAYATSGNTSRQTDFTITGAPLQTNLQSVFGMASSSNPGFPVYNNMPHCLYTAANGTLYLFDSGNFGQSFGSYAANDELKMEFIGTNVTYYLNGTNIYSKSFTPTSDLYLCASAGIAGATYSNITFIE